MIKLCPFEQSHRQVHWRNAFEHASKLVTRSNSFSVRHTFPASHMVALYPHLAAEFVDTLRGKGTDLGKALPLQSRVIQILKVTAVAVFVIPTLTVLGILYPSIYMETQTTPVQTKNLKKKHC